MAVHVALLRAVNVGGTGKLPMRELRTICEAIGFTDVRTYIQSGNVVFQSDGTSKAVGADLEARLSERLGRPVGVIMREPAALRDALARNPFPDAARNQVLVLFLNEAPPADVIKTAKGRTDEDIAVGPREVFIHCPSGIGASRLRLPVMDLGTTRNLNTVARIAEIAAAEP